MKKILALTALIGLSACTVHPNGSTTFHPPTVVHTTPVYVAPTPVYVGPVYRSSPPPWRPYYHHYGYRHHYYYYR